MRVIEMKDGLPKRENFKLGQFLNGFVRSGIKVAKLDLDPDDYASPQVARSVLSVACKRWAVPVEVKIRDGQVYLVRTDM